MKIEQVLFLTHHEESVFRELNRNQNKDPAKNALDLSVNVFPDWMYQIMGQFLNIGILNKFGKNETHVYFELSILGRKLLNMKANFVDIDSYRKYCYILDTILDDYIPIK